MMQLLFILLVFTAEPSISDLRRLYVNASTSKKYADEFLKVMDAVKSPKPLLISFHAMAYMIQAKHTANPYTKLVNFKKGKAMLENAIAKAPQDIEIRFMRFSVQTNAPAFLGYNNQINADKALILQNWKTIRDADLKSRIKEFMLNTSYCSENEKSVFR